MSSGLGRPESNIPASIHNIYSDNTVRDAFRHSFYNQAGKATPSPVNSKTIISRNNPDMKSIQSKNSRNSDKYSYAKLSRNSSQQQSKNSNKNAFDEY